MKINPILFYSFDFNINNFDTDNFIYNNLICNKDQTKNLNKFNFEINTSQNNFINLDDKNKDKTHTHKNKSIKEKIEEKLEEKIKKLGEGLKEEKEEKEKRCKYIIKYDKLLKRYYLEVIDPKTKEIIKTIPPEFLLKVERNLKKFLKLIENLEYLKKLKQNFHYQEIDKLLQEIKIISKDIELPEDDFKNLLSEYTESYFV